MSDLIGTAGCLEKLTWAKEHIEQIRAEKRAWVESNPVQVAVTEDHPGIVVARATFPAPPPRFAVLTGNVLHNLRSALDHLVWQLVLLNGQTPVAGGGGNSYPILDKPPDRPFLVKPPPGLRGVKPQHRAFIESTQPYKVSPGDVTMNALRQLREFSDRDKHQLLHVTALHGRTDFEQEITITSRNIDIIDRHFPPLAAWLYDGAVFAVVEIDPRTYTNKSEVEVHCHIPIDVALKFGDRVVPLTWHLRILADLVEATIKEFEPAFHGGPDPSIKDDPAGSALIVNFPV